MTTPSITWSGGTGIATTFTDPATYTDGQTVYVKVTLLPGYSLPSPLPAGWTANPTPATDTTYAARYEVILTDVNCTTATIPTFTPAAAVCVNGAPGQSSFSWTPAPVGVSVAVTEGATSLGSTTPISLDGSVPHTLTVTLTLLSGYAWPASMTGWTVTGTTATQNFIVPAIDCSADVSVLKTGNGPIVAGQNAIFTIVVTNTSTTRDAVGVTLSDVLPAGYVWTLGGADAAACTPLVGGTGTLSCNFGTLLPGATRTVTLTAPTNPHLCATINNTANVSATNDTVTTNNSSSATITVTCTASVIPSISTAPFVCVAGVTTGANTFTVNPGTGFTITSVLVGTTAATPTSTPGVYELPAANGLYMITVTATLNAGYTAPVSPLPDANGVYTFTQSVTVASCVPVTLGLPTVDPSVCLSGDPTEPVFNLPANVAGEVTYGGYTKTESPTGTFVFTYTATVAAGKTLPTTLPTSPYGSYAVDPANPNTVAIFTSLPMTLAECDPEVSILKEVNTGSGTGGAFEVGETIIFTITVTNTGDGDVAAPGVSFTDTINPALVGAAGLTWSENSANCDITAGVLSCSGILLDEAGGANDEFVVTLTSSPITATNPVCGPYTNTATLTGSYTGTSTVNLAIECAPQVEASKTTAVATVTQSGAVITYTVVVTNTGNQVLPNLAVNDSLTGTANPSAVVWGVLPAGVTLVGNIPVITSLGIDQTVTLTASYTVSQADIDAGGPIQNCITVLYDTDPSAASNCAITTVVQNPSIDIEKTSTVKLDTVLPTDRVDAGDVITYTFRVENTGNVTLNDVVVADPLPGLTWVSDPNIGTMLPGAWVELTATYVVLQADLDLGSVANCADVVGNPPLFVDETAPQFMAQVIDPTLPVSDQDCISTPLEKTPDIDIEKTSAVKLDTVLPADRVDAGDVITYTFRVENTGNVTLENVVVADPLPGLTWVSDPNIGTMLPGAWVELTATYIVLQADLDAGTVANCADVVGNPPLVEILENRATIYVTGVAEMPTSVDDEDCITTDIPQYPDIDIEKESVIDMAVVAPDTRVDAGDVITYTITVVNTGNVTLYNVSVVDPLVGLNETIPVLAPGDDAVFEVDYIITQENLDFGDVYNCADTTGYPPLYQNGSASSFMQLVIDPAAPVTDVDCITTDLPDDPSIDIEKSSTVKIDTVPPADRVDAGDEIRYSIRVENTGNVTLTNVVVTDPLVGLNETIPSLAPGDFEIFIAIYVVTLADLNAGTVRNCADVVGDGPVIFEVLAFAGMQIAEPYVSDEDCIDTDLEKEPGIDIEKSSTVLLDTVAPADRVDAGDTIAYTFVVTNTGNVTLENVVVADPLPGLTWVSDPNIGSLAPGAVVELTATYLVLQSDLDAGIVENCADVVGNPPTLVIAEDLALVAVTGDEPMPTTLTDEDCVTTDLEQEPAIDIEKTAAVLPGDDERVDAGDSIEYTFAVTNTGNVTLENVVVADPLPGLVWVSDPTIASLAPGATVDLTATFAVTQAAIDAGSVENCATAAAETVSDEDCITTDIEREPGVELDKTGTADTGDDDLLNVDEVITYTFAVTNTGNVTLTDLTIDDPLVGLTWTDGNTIASLAPGATVELEATYIVTQVDVDAGTVVNCADLTGTAADETPVTDDDCFTQLIDQDPSLLVAQVCQAEPAKFMPKVGDTVTFTIIVTNDGDLTVSDLVVTIDRDGKLDSPFPTSLEPGQSETRIYSVVVTQADYDARSIALEVSAEGTLPDGSVAKLASLVMLQETGAMVENVNTIVCPMGELPKPKPPVTNLPNTGSGSSMAASYATLWAATFTMVALGVGALGIRRTHR